jgi:hypothetical protein
VCVVTNLLSLEERTYSCSPKQAVIAAYAQSMGDWNTWDYEAKYGAKVQQTRHYYVLGNWVVRR